MKFSLGCLVVCILFLTTNSQLCDQLSEITTISAKCLKQLDTICRNGTLLWRMFDSSSKYPITGMAVHNYKDLGNFDECVGIDHEDFDGRILGKLCPYGIVIVDPFSLIQGQEQEIRIDLGPPKMNEFDTFSGYAKSLQAKRAVTPRITQLSVCIPDACTPEEAGQYFILPGLLESVSLAIFPEVPCQTKETSSNISGGDIAAITFLSIILLLIIVCTCYEYVLEKNNRKAPNPVYLAFSLINNGRKLFHVSTKTTPEQIPCLNGLRTISMIWIIAGHGFVVWQTLPILNQHDFDAYPYLLYSQYIASGPIAVDTFFFLSGMLLAYGYLKAAPKISPAKQVMGFPLMVVHRYLRITPAAAVLFFVTITLFHLMGSGPLWLAMVDVFKNPCVDYWWAYFLYVQNYVHYWDQCLNHTWYLSADFQMFLLAPLVLIPAAMFVKKKMKAVIIALIGLIVLCTGISILIPFVYYDYDNDYDTHSRLSDYLIGIIIGIILRETKHKPFFFTRLQNFCIWIVVLAACIAFNIYYHYVVAYVEHTEYSLFYPLYRPIWCGSLAWMVYSCYYGYGGFINSILSWPLFQVGGRLSYCMYLMHALVEAYYFGIIRTSSYFNDYTAFYIFCGHFIVTLLLAMVWSLAFESPMIAIERFIFGGGRKPPSKRVEEKEEKEVEKVEPIDDVPKNNI